MFDIKCPESGLLAVAGYYPGDDIRRPVVLLLAAAGLRHGFRVAAAVDVAGGTVFPPTVEEISVTSAARFSQPDDGEKTVIQAISPSGDVPIKKSILAL